MADELDTSNARCSSPEDLTIQTQPQVVLNPYADSDTWKHLYLERSAMRLDWINGGSEKECKERKEFPTWSWTRWAGLKCYPNAGLEPSYHEGSLRKLRMEIIVENLGWMNVFDQVRRLPALNGSKLGKMLRVTGNIVTPDYHKTPYGLGLILTTECGFELLLETFIDSLEWTLEDLADTVALEISGFFKSLQYGNFQSFQESNFSSFPKSNFRGTVLILKPDGEQYRRIGAAFCVQIGRDDFRTSQLDQIECGILAIAGATTRTVHIV